ncbi:MAG: GntR family transcriptional regulator [Caenispirillum bisanense]|nr:GntR family transcriptional regulator [Caenispirillum bisanense]MCA1973237.1 GntR family transcriptional regulator [Caenispirillum sp.]
MQSAASTIVDALRARIIQGALEQGARVMQDATAQEFGVSQTVVREAFQHLVAEGLLHAEPRRGVRVARLSAAEAAEITDLRALLEPQALALAVPRMTEETFRSADGVLARLAAAVDTEDLLDCNAAFHDVLYGPCGRVRTLSIITSLRGAFARYLRFIWSETDYREASWHDHAGLVALCRRRDVDAACDVLSAHIRATGTLLASRLDQLGQS